MKVGARFYRLSIIYQIRNGLFRVQMSRNMQSRERHMTTCSQIFVQDIKQVSGNDKLCLQRFLDTISGTCMKFLHLIDNFQDYEKRQHNSTTNMQFLKYTTLYKIIQFIRFHELYEICIIEYILEYRNSQEIEIKTLKYV